MKYSVGMQDLAKQLKKQHDFLNEPKLKYFQKYFNDIEDIDDYYIVLPEKFRGIKDLPKWVLFDKYAEDVILYKKEQFDIHNTGQK